MQSPKQAIKHPFSCPASFVADGRTADDYLHNSTYGNGMTAPDGWSDEALDCLPTSNTQNDMGVIISHVVGSATEMACHQGLLAGESDARHFYEDLRYLLSQRIVGIAPELLANWGCKGTGAARNDLPPTTEKSHLQAIQISHKDIDTLVSGQISAKHKAQWQSIRPQAIAQRTEVVFSETTKDWGDIEDAVPSIFINLLAFRGEDGQMSIERLRQATRLITILATMHGQDTDNLGLCLLNIPAMLTALGLPYDSDEGRATAMATASLVTATAATTSAKIAIIIGVTQSFQNNREGILRTLRNQARATYGDKTDYEKLSVLPAALIPADCPDLTLVATAQQAWREAIDLASKIGLRHTSLTGLRPRPQDQIFMSALSNGITPLAIKASIGTQDGIFILTDGLKIAGANDSIIKSAITHLGGHLSLQTASHINPDSLTAKGFDAEMIERLERYLPHARNIRHAATPWVIGTEACRAMGIGDAQIDDFSFDLLSYIGFSDDQIEAANAHIYGATDLSDCKALSKAQDEIFTTHVAPLAQIRMAACLQSVVSGTVPLALPHAIDGDQATLDNLVVTAWRHGLKGLVVEGVEFSPEIQKSTRQHQNRRQNAQPQQLTPAALAPPGIIARRSKKRAPISGKGKGKPHTPLHRI